MRISTEACRAASGRSVESSLTISALAPTVAANDDQAPHAQPQYRWPLRCWPQARPRLQHQARIDRRIASGYCDRSTADLDEAIALWLAARDERRALALALRGNAAKVLPAIAARGIMPYIVTDQTFPDPLKGYVPVELSIEEARAMRRANPEKLIALGRIAARLRGESRDHSQ